MADTESVKSVEKYGGSSMGNPRLNASGLPDPTAYQAVQELSDEERRLNQLVKTLKYIIHLAGYDLEERIVLQDRRTGRIHR